MKTKKTAILILVLAIIGLVVLTACGGGSAGGGGTVSPTWINPVLASNTVSVLVSDVEKYTMTHFKVNMPLEGQNYDLPFMTYKLGNQFYARANVCVPCGSESFTLDKDKLVCDSCGTIFDAKTGNGVSGVPACKNYPKASVAYKIENGNVVMDKEALLKALTDTLEPGLP